MWEPSSRRFHKPHHSSQRSGSPAAAISATCSSGFTPLPLESESHGCNGLKKGIDLSFLQGREVIQVAIGQFQVQFGFDEDVIISVKGGFEYLDGTTELSWKPELAYSQVAARTVALLGATINSFEAHGDGTLKLNFSNGHRLTIPDSSKPYESYSITRPGFNIYV